LRAKILGFVPVPAFIPRTYDDWGYPAETAVIYNPENPLLPGIGPGDKVTITCNAYDSGQDVWTKVFTYRQDWGWFNDFDVNKHGIKFLVAPVEKEVKLPPDEVAYFASVYRYASGGWNPNAKGSVHYKGFRVFNGPIQIYPRLKQRVLV
jgi:hypothetical protein